MTEEEHDRKSRHQRHFSCGESSRVCPVCGVTVRRQDLEAHFDGEIEQLQTLTTVGSRNLRYPHRRRRRQQRDWEDGESQTDSRYEEYLRLRRKRETRGRNKALPRSAESDGAGGSGLQASANCPVCGDALTGTPQEMNQHAEACLNKQASEPVQGESDEGDINIEDAESFEEYTWCGQTRVRATTMLEGGLQGCGFKTVQSGREDDDELDVEGDESVEYGPPRYSESDMVPLLPEGPQEHPVSGGTGTLQEGRRSNGYHDRGPPSSGAEDIRQSAISEAVPPVCRSPTVSPETKIKRLEEQLKELQKQVSNKHQTRCLICLDSYKKPVVSIQCWHVYCEECWMRTLGAKKLCPQCQMITSPNQLRRIYL